MLIDTGYPNLLRRKESASKETDCINIKKTLLLLSGQKRFFYISDHKLNTAPSAHHQ